MAIKAVLFDLDGTLWDSFPWYASVLAKYGDADEDQLLRSLRAGNNVVALYRQCGLSSSAFTKACTASVERLALFPGVLETLDALTRQGRRLGVVTSLSGAVAEPIVRATGLSRFLQVLIHAGNCRTRKPNPGPIVAALDALGVMPDANSFYVGDQPDDERAAAAAGLSFAWAGYGYASGGNGRTSTVLKDIRDIVNL